MRKLQKKLLVCLLLVCMVLPLGACGSAVEAAKQALEKKKQDDLASGEIETAHPGYLGSQDTFYGFLEN